jgi:hypothetical protein
MNTTTNITVKTIAALEGDEQFVTQPRYVKAEVLVDRVEGSHPLGSDLTVTLVGSRLKKDGNPSLNRSEERYYSRRLAGELPASVQAVIAAHDAKVAQIEALP